MKFGTDLSMGLYRKQIPWPLKKSESVNNKSMNSIARTQRLVMWIKQLEGIYVINIIL